MEERGVEGDGKGRQNAAEGRGSEAKGVGGGLREAEARRRKAGSGDEGKAQQSCVEKRRYAGRKDGPLLVLRASQRRSTPP